MTEYPHLLSYGYENYPAIVQIIVLAINVLGIAVVCTLLGLITRNENKLGDTQGKI